MTPLRNVILIGCKAAGKTTVGKALAGLAGMRFIDADAELEDLFFERRPDAGRLDCRAIYSRYGGDAMRKLESEVLRRLSVKTNTVIATGGGVVLAEENLSLLQAAGRTVFLDVPLPMLEERLAAHAASPLFTEKSVAELYRERYPLYLATASVHYAVTPGMTPAEIADALHRVLALGENLGQ